MARPLRIEYPGATYHITSRGNEKQRIFERGADRELFLDTLASVVERYDWVCHSYCLMNNHYHLLVETPRGNLSIGMRQLNGVYAQAFNVIQDRVGHLFEGRYKSILVDKDSYLLELSRYIVLNPVRAGIVGDPADWSWSSYRATAGLSPCKRFLAVGLILSMFSNDVEAARREYMDFVRSGTGATIWENLKGGIILGADDFVEMMEPFLERGKKEKEIQQDHRHATRPSLAGVLERQDWRAERDMRIHSAHADHGYTIRELSDYTGLSMSTIGGILQKQRHGRSGGRPGPGKFPINRKSET